MKIKLLKDYRAFKKDEIHDALIFSDNETAFILEEYFRGAGFAITLRNKENDKQFEIIEEPIADKTTTEEAYKVYINKYTIEELIALKELFK